MMLLNYILTEQSQKFLVMLMLIQILLELDVATMLTVGIMKIRGLIKQAVHGLTEVLTVLMVLLLLGIPLVCIHQQLVKSQLLSLHQHGLETGYQILLQALQLLDLMQVQQEIGGQVQLAMLIHALVYLMISIDLMQMEVTSKLCKTKHGQKDGKEFLKDVEHLLHHIMVLTLLHILIQTLLLPLLEMEPLWDQLKFIILVKTEFLAVRLHIMQSQLMKTTWSLILHMVLVTGNSCLEMQLTHHQLNQLQMLHSQ